MAAQINLSCFRAVANPRQRMQAVIHRHQHDTRRCLVFYVKRSRRGFPKSANPPSWFSYESSHVPLSRGNAHGNRCEPKIPHFYPWENWKAESRSNQEWRFSWGASKDAAKTEEEVIKKHRMSTDDYIYKILDRVVLSKSQYINHLTHRERIGDLQRWAQNLSSTAAKEANTIHTAFLNRMYEMTRPYIGREENQAQAHSATKDRPSDKAASHKESSETVNGNTRESSPISIPLRDIYEETEVDYITLKRVPKIKGNQNSSDILVSSEPTLIEALQNSSGVVERTFSDSNVGKNTVEIEMPSDEIKQETTTSNFAVADSDDVKSHAIHLGPPEGTTTITGVEVSKFETQAGHQVLEPVVTGTASLPGSDPSPIGTKESPPQGSAVTSSGHGATFTPSLLKTPVSNTTMELHHMQDNSSITQDSKIENSHILSADVDYNTPQPATKFQSNSSPAEESIAEVSVAEAYALPKLSPADLIASLRYYDRNRGRLPDEEPLSPEDVSILELARQRLEKESEARSRPARDSAQEGYAGKSRVKQVGFILGSAVLMTYVVGVGNKLLSQQSDSTAAIELLSAVKRSKDIGID